jgi:putative copper export protein
MVAPIVITILAYLHIISAMAWFGGAIVFLSVVAPGLRSLSTTASLEFLSKVGPKATRFFIGASSATIVFGLGLLAAFPDVLGTGLYIGIAIGLIAYLDAMLVAVPSLRKADHLAKEVLASGQAGPPPPEFVRVLKRGGTGVATVVGLLVITLMFMVVSGFPF